MPDFAIADSRDFGRSAVVKEQVGKWAKRACYHGQITMDGSLRNPGTAGERCTDVFQGLSWDSSGWTLGLGSCEGKGMRPKNARRGRATASEALLAAGPTRPRRSCIACLQSLRHSVWLPRSRCSLKAREQRSQQRRQAETKNEECAGHEVAEGDN